MLGTVFDSIPPMVRQTTQRTADTAGSHGQKGLKREAAEPELAGPDSKKAHVTRLKQDMYWEHYFNNANKVVIAFKETMKIFDAKILSVEAALALDKNNADLKRGLARLETLKGKLHNEMMPLSDNIAMFRESKFTDLSLIDDYKEGVPFVCKFTEYKFANEVFANHEHSIGAGRTWKDTVDHYSQVMTDKGLSLPTRYHGQSFADIVRDSLITKTMLQVLGDEYVVIDDIYLGIPEGGFKSINGKRVTSARSTAEYLLLTSGQIPEDKMNPMAPKVIDSKFQFLAFD
jgi:hypothetical protein